MNSAANIMNLKETIKEQPEEPTIAQPKTIPNELHKVSKREQFMETTTETLKEH